MKHCLKCNEINNNGVVNCTNCGASMQNVIKLEDCLKPEDRQRLKILGFSGEGSFGRVYRCQDLKLQKLVALKLIKEDCLGNELFIDLFKRECEFSKNIGEEHLVSTLDYCVNETCAYSIMEYIEGIELSAYLKKKKTLKLAEFKTIALQIACGLHFFHYHELLHCDLKPSNIMINPETLKLKLVDFGLSHFKFEENILDKDMIGGTRGYMSPEQENGVKALTAASDIYSVGVIYYEMLTGIRPIYDEQSELIPPSTFCDVLLAGENDRYFEDEKLDIEALSSEVINIVDYVDLLITRCLQKEPRSRFKSIEELKPIIEKAGRDFKLDILFDKNSINYEYTENSGEKSNFFEDNLRGVENTDTALNSKLSDKRYSAIIHEGSAVKKIKQGTLMTRIPHEPQGLKEQKTSKTLLLKYNKPRTTDNLNNKNVESERTPQPENAFTPLSRQPAVERIKKRGTLYSPEEKKDYTALKYIIIIITAIIAVALYSLY